MKHIYRFIATLFRSNISVLFQYRTSFYMGCVSSLLWMGLALISITIITYQAPTIGGWSREELYLVQGVYSLIFGIMYLVFVKNFTNLPQLVRNGNLDQLFLKPLDSQVMVSFGQFQLFSFSRIIAGIGVIIVMMNKLHISLTVPQTLLCFAVFASSLVIVYSIWFMVVTTSIWLVNMHNLSELLVQITGTTRYPLVIFRNISNVLFYIFLPLVVVTTVPAQVLLMKFDIWLGIWSAVIAVFSFIISRLFWKFALRYYTSASS